jgi:hypothetical protein
MPMFKKNLLPLSKPFCHSFGLASSTQGSKAIKHIFEELIDTKIKNGNAIRHNANVLKFFAATI